MERNAAALTEKPFDLLVIGGGILGACCAWDASLRGLDVALVDRGDFASGTSSNSLKTVHGGLRYLQRLDWLRMRESIRERSTWLRIAPHLVEPLPFLIPAYGHGTKGLVALGTALKIHTATAWDQHRDLQPERQLPADRVLGREECVELVPELAESRPKGGILVHDAQLYSSERLVWSIVQGAAEAGAVVANYVEFDSARRGTSPLPCLLRDRVSGESLEIRCRALVNAAGPDVSDLASRLTGRPLAPTLHHSVALNLMVAGLGHRVAFAFPSSPAADGTTARGRSRQLFIVPWRGRSIIGTGHYPHPRGEQDGPQREREVERFLAEVNAGWRGSPISRHDLLLVHRGLLPDERGGPDEARLLRHPRIVDHAADGIPGAISAVSVKLTEGRLLAERVVDLACAKLGRGVPPCRTRTNRIPGGDIESVTQLCLAARARCRDVLPPAVVDHLVRTYGSRWERILSYRASLPGWAQHPEESHPVVMAQLVHGVREELAQTAEDLLFRRTELGASGLATESARDIALRVLERELPGPRRCPPGTVRTPRGV